MSRFRAQSWTADGEINYPRQNVLPKVEEPLMELDEPKPKTGPKAIIFSQGKAFFLLIFSWILFILYIRLSRSKDEAISPLPVVLPRKKISTANLHLVVHAPEPDQNLCKLLVSAAITGYPSPVIVNWTDSSKGSRSNTNDNDMSKISGIHEYLSKLDPYQDEDLVLVVGGYDTWMQLRPQTLVDRYFEVNKRANENLAVELGRAARNHHIQQEVIFSSQKRCWPWTEDDAPCYAVPQSTLPSDIFDPQIDLSSDDKADAYVHQRPRFLNSGFVMGPVRAMRKTFAHAMVLLETEENVVNDQWIFGHIFGEQQLWREGIRRDSPLKAGKKVAGHEHHMRMRHDDDARLAKRIETSTPAEAKAEGSGGAEYEFGIGLDYEGLLGFATTDAEKDAFWLRWSDLSALRSTERRLGITPDQSRMRALARDIADTVPPFWTFFNEPRLARWTKWQDVPLLTNVWTGNVPALVHLHTSNHDTTKDAGSSLRKSWWAETWFHKNARTLYDTTVYEPVLPIAHSGPDETNLTEYWPYEHWKAGGRNGAGPWDPHQPNSALGEKWLPFDVICKDYHKEVFRDGKGPWRLPNVH